MQSEATRSERRRLPRSSVLRRAQVLFANTLHDCLVLDTSEGGARIQTATPISLPGRLVLRLSDGQAITASRAWSRGTDAGLEFAAEERGLGPDTAARLMAVEDSLKGGKFDLAVRQLRAARFFDDPEIRDAAEEAEGARMRLASVLRKAALSAS
ncbi:PilZ domain-containing protein [Falsiroseomonas sp.]|uniref:PilZ domain-containing protein n=1 Tax=Falsiroseomonas sp. TaxID=2870721 RepID=UPI003562EDF0